MARPKLLFVDDEASIRLTLPAILEMHGFEVTSCASVAEALTCIQKEKFEVLLSDLNIGEAGDGFTVVSAMRRTQPDAVTIIITGYPAFETALQAIRRQVDDYVVKPSNPLQLIETIQSHLDHRGERHAPPLRRVSYVLEDNARLIEQEFIKEMRASGMFPIEKLSDEEISDHVPDVVKNLVASLRAPGYESKADDDAARQHAITRCRQGFTMSMMLEESGILRAIIYRNVQSNLLGVDLSSLVPDLIRTGVELDRRLKEGMEAFLKKCPTSALPSDREKVG
jgi:ActR/RegA family two-component response regulator